MPPGRKLGQSQHILFCFPFLSILYHLCPVFEELFHTFCPIFWLFTPEGQVWYQILYHCLRFLLFSCSLLSDSLQPRPSLSPRVDSKLMSTESMMPSNHLILYCPLLLLPSTIPRIRVFSSELALCIRWPKYWSFSFNICPCSEYSEMIFFWIDWFDLLAVQGTPAPTWEHQFFSSQPFLCPTLTSVHDCWKNHSFDYTDLCQQSDISTF